MKTISERETKMQMVFRREIVQIQSKMKIISEREPEMQLVFRREIVQNNSNFK